MKSVIIGAGSYGEVYLAYLQESGVEVAGFLDDAKPSGVPVRGIPVLGKTQELAGLMERYGIEAVYCPLGNNRLRVKFLTIARELGFRTPNFIHRSVCLSPEVTLAGEGVYILPGSVIMPYVTIEKYVMISIGVKVAHHSYLSEGTFLSCGTNFGAGVHAEQCVCCSMGSTIMTGVRSLGADCLIGAGSVVIHDVAPKAVVAGVPARFIRAVEAL